MTGNMIDPRLATFRRKLVKHASVEVALTQLIGAVKQPRPECVLVFVGPSGVGKSTTIQAVEKHLRIIHAERMREDPGFLPYLSLRAPTPLDGHFNWKDMFTRTLSAAGEVLIERKIVSHFEMELDGRVVDSMKGLVREELRRSLESLVRHRSVPVIILDEASALLRLKRGAVPQLQFEILKSLAVELRIPIVLVGAYDLLGILDGDGQLLRRSQIIHCPRYLHRADDGSVDPDFRDALNALIQAIEIPMEPGLADSVDILYMKSAGCVGVLKDWLDRALVAALAKGEEPYITRQILVETALPNSQVKRLLREAKAGELRLIQIEDSELAKEFGFEYTPAFIHTESRHPKAASRGKGTTNENEGRGRGLSSRAGRACVRGPSRDQVGGKHE